MANPINDIHNSFRIAKATYDFSVVGGAISTIILPGADEIPSGAIVTGILVDCRTIVTGAGGATVAITGGGLTLIAADTLANQELDETGVAWLAAGGTESTAVYVPQKATSSAPIKAVVAVGALTAGIFDVYVQYMI